MSELSAQQIADAASGVMLATDRASKHIGMAIDLVEPGRAITSITVEDHLVNGLEVCHGGYIFSLADTAMAFASNSYNNPALAQSAQITFLAPGKPGDRLTATASCAAQAGRTGIWDVDVRNQDGVQIAVFRGQTRVIPGKIADL
ncbi:MAG: hydroxyphenylacetyl-CoA thioesterase PaaI [Alphaproteobacteria bacterium]|jgi:acyl-CoA thioesterase